VLSRVTLTNFQSHKLLDLELGAFTTLTGGSNGGKSAVLRAILALVRNDSAGDYLRHGQKTLSVKLTFDTGDTVEWVKGSGENKYILNRPGEKEQVFDKVGAGVPDEVAEVLRLGPIVVGKGDKQYVNFHQQLESPFLISATPGDVAKLFGELTSASQLYTAVNEGNRVARGFNATRSTRMGDLRQTKIDLEDFSDLEAQQEALSTVKGLLEAAENVCVRSETLEKGLSKVLDVDNRITEASKLVDRLSGVESSSLDELLEAGTAVETLQSLIDAYETCIRRISKGTNGLVYLDKATSTDLSALQAADTALEALQTLSAHLETNGAAESRLEADIASAEGDIERLTEQVQELVQELSTCLECNQHLTDEAKDFLLTKGSEYVTH